MVALPGRDRLAAAVCAAAGPKKRWRCGLDHAPESPCGHHRGGARFLYHAV